MTLVPGSQIGKYIVRCKLAEGGMAELYLCSLRGLEGFEKDVVIKRIRPHLSSDPQFVQMFVSEALLASRLNHPNVVQIFDFDKHEDSYYLAMEYVHGHSLAEVRKRCKAKMVALPPTLAAQIGMQIARGLHYVHCFSQSRNGGGLVHRDVSPHNVLLSFDGAVKLTDFGIAEPIDAAAPRRLKGKLAYMSPEQSRGEPVDARTDVFALGIVVWEMMTGGRLFEGNGDAAILQAVRESAIPPAARLNPDVPLDLDAVVMKALQRPPELRYQAAAELERALAACLLKHARRLEDTDVAGFMRRLFPDELAQAAPAASVALPPAKGNSSVRKEMGFIRRQMQRWSKPRRIVVRLLLGALAVLVLVASPRLYSRPEERPSAEDSTGIDAETSAAAVPLQTQTSVRATELPSAPAPSPNPSSQPMQTGDGTLVLKIAPWAFLSIDGQPRGEVSGMKRYRLAPGKHRVRLWHPRGSKEVEILLAPGERRIEEYQLYSRLR